MAICSGEFFNIHSLFHIWIGLRNLCMKYYIRYIITAAAPQIFCLWSRIVQGAVAYTILGTNWRLNYVKLFYSKNFWPIWQLFGEMCVPSFVLLKPKINKIQLRTQKVSYHVAITFNIDCPRQLQKWIKKLRFHSQAFN